MSDFESKMDRHKSTGGIRAMATKFHLMRRWGVDVGANGIIRINSMDYTETWRPMHGTGHGKESMWEMVSREKTGT